ncbi:MAG: Carboxyl-terminal protease [Clostridiales bacterium 38_11]|nr:MAG: Carboxyl-terminal protease [Clostridiales bacterium 38_11]
MISKKRALLIVIIVILITFSATLAGTTYLGFKTEDKIIIPMDRYNALRELEKKYEKNEYISRFVKDNFLYEKDESVILEGALKGMLDVLEDPYSEYLTPEEFNSLIEQTQGEYSGIGVYVSVTEDNKIVVVSPIEDTPADKAGLRTGDFISKVNGVEYLGDKLSDAVNVMKGIPGTDVTITINRTQKDGSETSFDVVITRQNIKIETIKSEMLEDKIGYIRITTFDQQTDEDFNVALRSLSTQAMVGLIIDLRYNPGGLITSVTEIADVLLGETIITYTQTRDGQREYYNSDKKKVDVPMVILINEGSASASEILAGAVKDTKSGTLVGTKTFGKGIVQRIMPLEDGSGIKLTVSEYFTPNDVNIHGIGIEPDVYVELPEDVAYGPDNIAEDVQLQRAVEIIKLR